MSYPPLSYEESRELLNSVRYALQDKAGPTTVSLIIGARGDLKGVSLGVRFRYMKQPFRVRMRDGDTTWRVLIPTGIEGQRKNTVRQTYLAQDGAVYNDPNHPDVVWHPQQWKAMLWVIYNCGFPRIRGRQGRVNAQCKYCPNQLSCMAEPSFGPGGT